MSAPEDRLERLEERLRALEEAVAGTEGPPSPAPSEPSRFWALESLRGLGLPDGGAVLFTGLVELPGGTAYEWQETQLATALLEADWAEIGTALAALANPVRLSLLREVLGGRTSAADLTALESMGTSGQVYHHLRQLTAAGWLRAAERGRYRIPAERVIPLLVLIAAARR